MKRLEEDFDAVSAEITRLREIGTAEAKKYADAMEVRLILMKQKANRMEMLTIERIQEWTSQILRDAEKEGKGTHDVSTWPLWLRNDLFEALQTAWAACRFRAREAAEMMGVTYPLVLDWLHCELWKKWLDENPRREDQVRATADMALQRAASILAYDTDDPNVLKVQSQTIKTVLTAGLSVGERLPGKRGGERRPGKPRDGLSAAGKDARRSFEKYDKDK